MKKSLIAFLCAATFGLPAIAHTSQQIQEDITRHRAMAAAHEAAAKCLESGREKSVCHQELQAACQGLGIGRYCGMRHVH